MLQTGVESSEAAAQLLESVAEQLKVPLSAIARQAELSQLTGIGLDAGSTRVQATAALTLVESYLLGLQLMHRQADLPLEPVSLSSLLVDTAHELHAFAKEHEVHLGLHIGGKYQPVMAHRSALRSALLALGFALVEGRPPETKQLTLAVHRTPHGLVTGLYGAFHQLHAYQWRQALQMITLPQPIAALCGGNGAGLFVAEALLEAMQSRLRVSKYRHQYGLAATLLPSHQLQFV